uniref:TIGR03943 family putative permease subunit n=1 Tax=Streptococcus pneumoniae TaxID=1313 RepID=UPI003F493594
PPPNSQILCAVGIRHCIADSGIYGLLTKGNTRQYENNTWITAKGKLVNHYHKELQQNRPTLEIASFTKVDKPENPY